MRNSMQKIFFLLKYSLLAVGVPFWLIVSWRFAIWEITLNEGIFPRWNGGYLLAKLS